MTIEERIDQGYIIVLDTNIILNIYRYSPDFSDFALKCMKRVSGSIILPSTVRLEYEKHRRSAFSNMKKRIAEVGKETEKQIKNAKNKIISSCSIFKRLQYVGADELISILTTKMDAVHSAFTNYFDDNASLNLIQHSWGDNDYLFAFIQEIDSNGQIMPSVSQEDIYRWCEEGESRYKRNIPPGFKDAKKKDGVRKYSDLIMWKEILLYAKNNSKDIIFVTDDVKSDWYETIGETDKFHSKLLSEFSETGQQIIPMTSKSFLTEVSKAYGIEQSDAIEIALQMTDENYFNLVCDSIFESVIEQLVCNASDYIDDSTAHIGSEGIDEFEITDDRFDSAERIERDDDRVVYEFIYFVALRGISHEYWGRDDDTREIITSPGRDHKFEGYITIRVEREVQMFFDFEDDNSFDNAEIVSGDIKEISYSDYYDGFDEPGEFGYCPDCGVPLNVDNDSSGFCIDCAKKRD